MITLSVVEAKSKKSTEEIYTSMDKAKTRLNQIVASKGKLILEGASYEEDEEKTLVLKYLSLKK